MSSNLRVTGLASGIDTEEMIQKLMEAENIKVDRAKQDKQLKVWTQEIYNELNKDFANFILNTRKDFGLTSVTSTGSFVPNSYKNVDWIMKATSSDPSVATVSASTNALNGNYSVNVKNLAEGISVYGSGINDKDIAFNLEDPIQFTINEKEFIIGNTEGIENNSDKVIINMNLDGAKLGDVLGKLSKEINSMNNLGFRASYDSGFGVFFLNTTDTGSGSNINIDATNKSAGNFFGALGLKVDDPETEDIDETKLVLGKEYTGRDAEFTFNGIDLTSSTNNISINGINMNIKGEDEFTINVSTDVDSAFEKISGFIDEYNKLVDKTNGLLSEKRYYDYKPLTEAQRDDMDEKEIELWEEKARSGLLRSDDIISRSMQNIRSDLYKSFDGPFSLITQIGISTEKFSRGEAGGRLEIDEQKLKEALAKDPNAVMEMFFEEDGLVSRVYDNMIDGMEDIITKSGTGNNNNLFRDVKSNILVDFVSSHGSISALDKNITDFDKKIDELTDALARRENYYYSQFAAMESFINQMNSQSMWLAQQFGGY